MIWTSNLVNTPVFFALHDRKPADPKKTDGPHICWYRYFLYVFIGAFVWCLNSYRKRYKPGGFELSKRGQSRCLHKSLHMEAITLQENALEILKSCSLLRDALYSDNRSYERAWPHSNNIKIKNCSKHTHTADSRTRCLEEIHQFSNAVS